MISCRSCGTRLEHTFVDLGCSPVANDFIRADFLSEMEPFYPLCVYICQRCLLVQLPAACLPQSLFNAEYAYFSSFSDSWLAHARRYAETVMQRFGIGPGRRVVEVASNDGYLLQYFKAAGVTVRGIEPAANCAEAAMAKGIPTTVRFFGAQAARELVGEHAADLMVANNVLAHVPDINDFVEGFRILLKADGVATFEFPHLLHLIAQNEFDTIYHEHYSYLSLHAVEQVFAAHGMQVFDVEELPTHGGSLRLFVQHTGKACRPVESGVAKLREKERLAGLTELAGYQGFESRVRKVKRDLLRFLIAAREDGKSVVGYGAPAKGNTLLNYCGIRTDLLDYTVDRSPRKQGWFLPGTRIPVYAPERIMETRPDYILILPWNLQSEITQQMKAVREWGARFVVPIPELKILP
jgi:SAM-dependent methyltransferase